MSPSPDLQLWIIIPVYDNWTDTGECLASLAAQTSRDFHLILADDGSSIPPPAECLAHPFVQYQRNPHQGFGANCGAAIERAIAQGATHVLLLNDDTVVGPRFVERWLETVAPEPGSILSPLIYYHRDPDTVWHSGGKWDIWTPYLRLKEEFKQRTEVDIICGCAMLIPVPAWRALHGFDPIYPTYYEDFDFCIRARQRGMTVAIVPHPDLKVLHKISGSMRKQGRWRQQYMLATTRLFFIRRNYRGLNKWLCLALWGPYLAAVAALLFAGCSSSDSDGAKADATTTTAADKTTTTAGDDETTTTEADDGGDQADGPTTADLEAILPTVEEIGSGWSVDPSDHQGESAVETAAEDQCPGAPAMMSAPNDDAATAGFINDAEQTTVRVTLSPDADEIDTETLQALVDSINDCDAITTKQGDFDVTASLDAALNDTYGDQGIQVAIAVNLTDGTDSYDLKAYRLRFRDGTVGVTITGFDGLTDDGTIHPIDTSGLDATAAEMEKRIDALG